jgi:hypothetical protein
MTCSRASRRIVAFLLAPGTLPEHVTRLARLGTKVENAGGPRDPAVSYLRLPLDV